METSRAIVQLIGSFQGGGAQRLALNLGEALGVLGWRSVAVALRGAGAFAESGRPAGVEVHALNAERSSRASVLRAAWALRALLRRTRAEVLHVHGSGCVVVAALALVGWRRRPRLVFTWHDSGTVVGGRGIARRLTVWALRRCDALFGSSRDVAMRLERACGRPARVFVNGVPERARSGAFDDAAARVLWMGRLVPVKDPETMLRAMARAAEPASQLKPVALAGGSTSLARREAQCVASISCVLAGAALPHGAAFEARCRALVAELGLEGVVSMPGWVAQTDALIAASNIGVQSSRSEGLSMALLEQMMAGMAVVATDVGDTDRAVEHERTGLLVPPGDEAALGAAILRVAGDAALRRRLGAAARERAIQEFSLAAMAARAIEEYRRAGARL